MFGNILRSFVPELKAQVDECIKRHPEYESEIVSFTCNFFLLIGKFSKVKDYYRRFFHSNVEIQDLMKSIDKSLTYAKYKAIDSGFFVRLRDWKKMKDFSFDDQVDDSCSYGPYDQVDFYLEEIYMFLHTAFYRSGVNDLCSEKKGILDLTHEMCCLIRNCLKVFITRKRPWKTIPLDQEGNHISSFRSFTYFVEDDFINSLKILFTEQVQANPQYKPYIVRFTYSFLLFMQKWEEIQGYYNNTAKLKFLIEPMYRSLTSIKSEAIIINMFVQLKDQELIDEPDRSRNRLVSLASLQDQCEDLCILIQENYKVLGNADTDLRGMRIFSLTREMYVLIQNCINSIRLEQGKFIVNGYQQIKNYLVSSYSSIIDNLTMTLSDQINYHFRANTNHKPQAMRFTFAFSWILEHWRFLIEYYNGIIKRYGFITLKNIVENIDRELLYAKLNAIQICMFVNVDCSLKKDSYLHEICTSGYVASLCQNQLKTVYRLIQKAFNISGIDDDVVESERIRVYNMTQEICTFIHCCLESFKPIEEHSSDIEIMVLYPRIIDSTCTFHNQVEQYVKSNPKYSVDVARFSYSFELLRLQWCKVRAHYSKFILNDFSFIKLEHLMKVIDNHLSAIYCNADSLEILVEPKSKYTPSDHYPEYLFMSCKKSFEKIYESVKYGYDLLNCDSGFNSNQVTKVNMFNLTQDIRLLSNECIKHIQLIEHSVRCRGSDVKSSVERRSSSIKSFVERKSASVKNFVKRKGSDVKNSAVPGNSVVGNNFESVNATSLESVIRK